MDKAFIKNPVEAYEKLKEENKKFKAENETYKKMLEYEEVILALNEARTGEQHLWFNKAEKYKQTLAEIKEIVCLELAYGTNEEYANFYMQQREAILLKINECEGDNEV